MQETTMILDRLRVVKIDARIWGGRKKLRKEDLILADGSVLPPEEPSAFASRSARAFSAALQYRKTA